MGDREIRRSNFTIGMMLWRTKRTNDSLRNRVLTETATEFESRFKELVRIARGIDKSNRLLSLQIEVLVALFSHNLDNF
jgi:hypothetical protein